MHQMTFQRVCVWCGIACVTVFFVGFVFADFIPPLAANDSAEEIAQHYRDNTTGIRIGACFIFLSGMFYAAYVAVISAQMSRIPGVPRAAVNVQLAAGAFACVTFLLPALFFVITAFRPERDPATTQLLNDISWIMLVMPWPPFMAQNFAFAYAIFSDPRQRPLFPRWLAYVNIWAPIVYSPAILIPFFKSGPFFWGGVFVFWLPATVFILQFIANVAMLLRAISDEEQEAKAGGKAAARSPSAAPVA